MNHLVPSCRMPIGRRIYYAGSLPAWLCPVLILVGVMELPFSQSQDCYNFCAVVGCAVQFSACTCPVCL